MTKTEPMDKLKTEYEHVRFTRNDRRSRCTWNVIINLDEVGHLYWINESDYGFQPYHDITFSLNELRDILAFMEQLAGTPATKGTE